MQSSHVRNSFFRVIAIYMNLNYERLYVRKRYYVTERHKGCHQRAFYHEVWILRYSRKFMKLSVGWERLR